MNKMTIFFIVLVLAFVSFGALVYAGNRQDSIKIEKTEKVAKDSLIKAQIEAIDSLRIEMTRIQKSLEDDHSSLRIILFVGAVAVVIFMLLFVLTFLWLTEKASKKRLHYYVDELESKIYKAKEESREVSSHDKGTNTGQVSRQQTPQRKGGNEKWHQGNGRQKNDGRPTPPPPPEKIVEPNVPRPIEKVVYLKNNVGDIFTSISEQPQETSTFKVVYNPDDKSNIGELHIIGKILDLKVMNKESRDCSIKLVKSSCDWNEAYEYSQDHAGKVRREGDVWTILNPVEIILKKQ